MSGVKTQETTGPSKLVYHRKNDSVIKKRVAVPSEVEINHNKMSESYIQCIYINYIYIYTIL